MLLTPFKIRDFVLRDVPRTQLSDPVHTPNQPLRVTQSNFGKYLLPIEVFDNGDVADITPAKSFDISDQVLQRWTKRDIAWWVTKPGCDDYFVHNLHRTHILHTTADDFNPVMKPKNQLFPRSYRYELDCIERMRRSNLRRKLEKELNRKEEIIPPPKSETKDSYTCQPQPPFWWSEDQSEVKDKKPEEGIPEENEDDIELRDRRWTIVPSILKQIKRTPCERRLEISRVGQPFRSEACNWYYENYPVPYYQYRKKRLA